MKKNKIWIAMVSVLALSACGSSDSGSSASGDETPEPTSQLVITAVDPYVTGAEFCIDADENGVCGPSELTSIAGTEEGQYIFQNYEVTADTNIIASQNGLHNGESFMMALKARIAAGSQEAVLNPSTTILADKGITFEQLAEILNQFALTNPGLGEAISADELAADPIAGLLDQPIGELTTHEIALIRAQVVLTGMERVASGSDVISALTADEFIASAMVGGEDGDAIYQIISSMMSGVSQGISTDLLGDIAGVLESYESNPSMPVDLPEITVRDVLNTAIAIMNRISEVGYTACNDYNQAHTGADYSVADNIAAVEEAINALNPTSVIPAWAATLGQRYYGANHKTALSAYASYLPTEVQVGFNATTGHFRIDTTNQVSTIE